MAYCYYCGAQLGSHDKYCGNCGHKVKKQNEVAMEDLSFNQKIVRSFQKVMDTPDHTNEFGDEDIEIGQNFAMFSYLGPLILVPVIAVRGSRYTKFHIGQGLNLFLGLLIYSIVLALFYVLTSWIPMFGNFFIAVYDIMEALGIIAAVLLAVKGIQNSNNGKARELPFIGRINLVHYWK